MCQNDLLSGPDLLSDLNQTRSGFRKKKFGCDRGSYNSFRGFGRCLQFLMALLQDKTGGTEGLGMGQDFDDMKGLLDIVNWRVSA